MAISDRPGPTLSGGSLGYTAAFAAPEQLRHRPTDARSDVFSLAASLYYALAYGDPQHREPDQFDPALVAAEFRATLIKALQRNPDQRHRNAAEFRAALKALCLRPHPFRRTARRLGLLARHVRPVLPRLRQPERKCHVRH